jgi:hypothetical protein
MDWTWLWQGIVVEIIGAVLVGLMVAWFTARHSKFMAPILYGLFAAVSTWFIIFGFKALYAPPNMRLVVVGLILVLVVSIPTAWVMGQRRRAVTALVPLAEQASFTLRDVYQSPEDPNARFKWKLYIILSNDTPQTLNIQALNWVGGGKVAFLLPEVMLLQLESGVDSWVNNQWKKDESPIGLVRPGQVFRTWVGLQHRYEDVHIRRWQISKLLGTLSIKVASSDLEERVKV